MIGYRVRSDDELSRDIRTLDEDALHRLVQDTVAQWSERWTLNNGESLGLIIGGDVMAALYGYPEETAYITSVIFSRRIQTGDYQVQLCGWAQGVTVYIRDTKDSSSKECI